MASFVDAGTLILVLAIGCMLFGGISLASAGRTDIAIRYWSLGYFLAGAGVLALALRGYIPDLASIQGANIGVLIGIGLMLIAIITHAGRDHLKLPAVTGCAVAIIVFNLASLPPFNAPIEVRIAIVSAAIAMSQLFALYALWGLKTERSNLLTLMRISHLVLSIAFILRFISGLQGWAISLFIPNPVNVLFYVSAMAMAFIQAPTFLLMKKEQADRRAVRAEEELSNEVSERAVERRFHATRMRVERAGAIEHFARGVAHDANTMIGVLQLGFGQIRNDIAESKPVPAETLNLMEKALAQARVTASGLLALGGKKSPTLTQVNVSDVLDEVASMLAYGAPREIAVRNETPKGLLGRAHRGFLSTALLNIGRNGIEAMAGGGTLTLSARRLSEVPKGDYQVGSVASGPIVDISVTDEGPGIARDTLNELFEPMVTTKEEQDGHGYGLYMARGVAERLGAAIVVQTQRETGTVMHFLLASGERK